MSKMNDDRDKTLDTLFTKDREYQVPVEETRSKRGNILFTPSLYDDMRILAKAENTSFNDLLNRLCQEYADNNREFIEAEREHQEHIEKLIAEANRSRKNKK